MTFTNDAMSVLQEKGYMKHCSPLDKLSGAVEHARKIVKRKVIFYKWFGFALLISIPLASAALAVLINANDPIPCDRSWRAAGPCLSVFLTFLTILNSIFKPSERFREACLISIAIERFTMDFMMKLEAVPNLNEAEILQVIRQKWEEFEKYEIGLIAMFMPLEVAERRAANATADRAEPRGLDNRK